MKVFLIHGMGRTRASMALLGRRLQRAGHTPSLYGYAVAFERLESVAEGFTRHVEQRLQPGQGYAVIGHSLGNVITRLSSPHLPEGFSRFAMLAPPNRSPSLARAMRKSPIFRALTGDAGQKLVRPGFLERLPQPDVPTAILAGDTRAPWLPYRGAASDGIVGVEETRLPGVPHRTYNASHTFIMNHGEVTKSLMYFLEAGVLDTP